MIRIIADSREQAPYSFSSYPAQVIRGTLDTGDYSIPGFTDTVAIERKELGDLLACITRERERFTRELDRLRGYRAAALVIESPFCAIAGGCYRSKVTPESAVQSIISIMEKYRIPVFFADDRNAGEYFVFNFLRHFTRHETERLKALGDVCGGQGGAGK